MMRKTLSRKNPSHLKRKIRKFHNKHNMKNTFHMKSLKKHIPSNYPNICIILNDILMDVSICYVNSTIINYCTALHKF